MENWEDSHGEKKKKNSKLIFIFGAVALLVVGVIGAFLFSARKKDENNKPTGINIGEQQRQQVREASSQLVGSILDNQSNFNQLTTNPDGTRRNVDDVEEIF